MYILFSEHKRNTFAAPKTNFLSVPFHALSLLSDTLFLAKFHRIASQVVVSSSTNFNNSISNNNNDKFIWMLIAQLFGWLHKNRSTTRHNLFVRFLRLSIALKVNVGRWYENDGKSSSKCPMPMYECTRLCVYGVAYGQFSNSLSQLHTKHIEWRCGKAWLPHTPSRPPHTLYNVVCLCLIIH